MKEAPLWSRTHIQKALGDTLHLGGLELTEYLVTQAGIKPDWRVLDVACGTGQSVVHLRRRHGVKAFGCDVLFSQIKSAQNQGISTRFTPLSVADAHEIPFLCGSMDMILCECALSLMQSPIKALQSMRSVLKKDGILAISDLYLQGGSQYGMKDGMKHTMQHDMAKSPLPQGSCLTWAAHKKSIEKLVCDAGFELISFEDHSYLLKELAAKLAFIGEQGTCAAQDSHHKSCSCMNSRNRTAQVGYFTLLAKVARHCGQIKNI
ncbi:MAG: class I SAM-dependent methyltransferase [Pseudomonadota bacterium]